jgi:hypothetical protein
VNAHFEVHLYNFLTSRIPLPAYLLATLLLGWLLARWQSRPTLAAAGGVLIWLSIPLMGTERALLAFLFAPLTMLRFGRIALLHIWPAFAYRTYGLDMYGPLWSAKGLFLFDRLSGEGLIGTAISNAV